MAVSVLVVEDDKNIADLLQLYLEKEGYAVTVASDGGMGLEKFRTIGPDDAGDGWLGRLQGHPLRKSNPGDYVHCQVGDRR